MSTTHPTDIESRLASPVARHAIGSMAGAIDGMHLARAFAGASPHHLLYADSPEGPFSFAAQCVRTMPGDILQ